MKLLIYGGCHASAIKFILDKYSLCDVVVDTLVNYRLISTREPFPFDRLLQYDFVLFNPILNRAEYNTTLVEDHCRAKGIRFFKYPWLQWGGYWPLPKKRTWGSNAEWALFHQREQAEKFAQKFSALGAQQQFEAYYESLFEGAQYQSLMEQEVEKTTRQLQSREKEEGVDIKISDYILENYREKQLFLTPDHPTVELYKFVVPHIASALGISLDPSFASSRVEIQEGIRTPILPGVADALGLAFHAADWGNDEFLGDCYYSLRDYARTTFPGLPIRLATACNTTRIKSADSDDATPFNVKKKLLIQLRQEPTLRDHLMVDVLGPLPLRRTRALLYKPHWQLDAPSF
jgi:Polysaccharide biosynthesis enzyme WcbI